MLQHEIFYLRYIVNMAVIGVTGPVSKAKLCDAFIAVVL